MENMGNLLKICFVVTCVVLSCRAPLDEIKSTQQRWCLESKGMYGINYHFTVRTARDYRQIRLDSIWLHNRWVKQFHYSVLGKSNIETQFEPGDTILISVNVGDTIQGNSCLLRYSFRNKHKEIMMRKWVYLKNLCP